MNKVALVLAFGMGFITLTQAASPRQERGIAECMMSKAKTRLHDHLGGKKRVTAQVATDAAMDYAYKHCKGRLTEGESDYVYHSISALASRWFGD